MPAGPAQPPSPLPWLAQATEAAMRAAWEAHGGIAAPARAEAAAREVALARHPALPLTMIGEAVDLVSDVRRREGRPAAPC